MTFIKSSLMTILAIIDIIPISTHLNIAEFKIE